MNNNNNSNYNSFMTAKEYNNAVESFRTARNAIMNAMPPKKNAPGAPKKNNTTRSRVYRLHNNNMGNNDNNMDNNDNNVHTVNLNKFHAPVGNNNKNSNSVFGLVGGPGELPANVQNGGRRLRKRATRKNRRTRSQRK
jgi:hypothetical protein